MWPCNFRLGEVERRKCKSCVELSHKLLGAEADLKKAERRSTKDLQCEQCPVLHREIESLKKKIDEQNERDCPNGEESNTSTLCDPERPSRLCATFRDIFHGSWNDAYEHLTETDDETTAIHNLLGVVQNSYKFGEGVFNQYLTALNEALVGPCRDKEISKNIQLMNLNYAKRMAKLVKDDIVELYISTTEYKSAHPVIQTFCTEVVGICWRFLCHDPPLKLLIDPDTRQFNTDWFDEYKHKGRSMAYVVWPVVYREENKKKDVLSKGIAEAK